MKFLTRNYLVNPTLITEATNQATAPRICDKDIQSKWISSGALDGTTTTMTIILSADATINRICLMVMNLKTFTVQYSSTVGGALSDFSVPINETNNSSADKFYSFDPVVARKIVLMATNTFPTSAEKYVSELLAYYEMVDIPDEWLPDETAESDFPSAIHSLVTGGKVRVYLGTLTKYSSIITFQNLTPIYSDVLRDIYLARREFYFMPYSSTPGDQYCVVWLNEWNFMKRTAFDEFGNQCVSGSIEIGEV